MDPPQGSSTLTKVFRTVVGVVILGVTAYVVYAIVRWARGFPVTTTLGIVDQVPEAVDGRSGKVIPSSKVPLGAGSSYGLQYWMYIQDWDTGFGKEKMVIKRVDPANGRFMNPKITLHPTDNSLNVSVSVFPRERLAPAGAQMSADGGMFTCTVENVPLQAWFSVSITVFQRNLDIYINGRLVKSCVLPGVPREALGDITLGSATNGFSGKLCTLKSYTNSLSPQDAMRFFDAGTACTSVVESKTDTGSSITLFGYTFKFSVFNQKGQEVRNYSF